MCGRFTLQTSLMTLGEHFLFDVPADITLAPRFNISQPTQSPVGLESGTTSLRQNALGTHPTLGRGQFDGRQDDQCSE